MEFEVAIIGGGLSGLSAAQALSTQGRSFCLLEARPRLGGRIETETVEAAGFDLGPAWIWPHNRRLLALTKTLGLSVFEQYSSGRFAFEDRAGHVRRDLDFATMGGGGPQS
ncbi:MAG: FAD-dependent oxidoreductase [Pseudomonadota bacterium]